MTHVVQELRRGADPATIYSLALSRGCEWLAVSSHKGTVHIFSLAQPVHVSSDDLALAMDTGPSAQSNGSDGAAGRTNPTSIFSVVKVSAQAAQGSALCVVTLRMGR